MSNACCKLQPRGRLCAVVLSPFLKSIYSLTTKRTEIFKQTRVTGRSKNVTGTQTRDRVCSETVSKIETKKKKTQHTGLYRRRDSSRNLKTKNPLSIPEESTRDEINKFAVFAARCLHGIQGNRVATIQFGIDFRSQATRTIPGDTCRARHPGKTTEEIQADSKSKKREKENATRGISVSSALLERTAFSRFFFFFSIDDRPKRAVALLDLRS